MLTQEPSHLRAVKSRLRQDSPLWLKRGLWDERKQAERSDLSGLRENG